MPAAKNVIASGPGIGNTNLGGLLGGLGSLGSTFKTLSFGGRAPNAPIKPVTVAPPARGDFGQPGAAPSLAQPSRGDYGEPSRAGLDETAFAGRAALGGFLNPTGTTAFKNLMNLAQEQTGAQAQEVQRHAADAASRRGYAGGFEDTARQTAQDRMTALALAGGTNAASVQQAEGEMYGKAIGAFTELQKSYNEAKATGDVAYAHDLTTTRIQDAQNRLSTMDLNQRQQLAYADAVNQAKQLQASLNEQFNKDMIDNNRFIQGQQQIATQLAASLAALQEKAREFDVTTKQSQAEMEERKREFDLGLKANPMTALRTFGDNRFGSGGPAIPGKSFGAIA